MENTNSGSGTPPAPKPIGRRAHSPTEPDRQKVSRMSSKGIPQYQIANIFDISLKTLRKHYRKELTDSAVEANFQVVETLFQMATSGANAAASIFWAKTRCGFRSGLPAVPDAGEPTVSARSAPPIEPPPPGSVIFTEGKAPHEDS
jgi:hypothetical protein